MKALLQHIQQASDAPIGVILYIGAGKGELLPLVRSFGAERLVICEPNPANVDILKRDLDPARHESVLPYALVADAAESTELYVLNNTRYNSTASPLGILDLRSNLKVDATITVTAKPIRSVIEDLNLSAKHTNLLILNALGSNAALLQAVPFHLLCHFEWIVVTGMQIADAYVGDRSIVDVADLLQQEQKFDLAMNDDEAIHPNAAVLFHRHPLVLRILELEEQSINVERALNNTSQVLEKQQEQLRQAVAEHTSLTKLAEERAAQVASLTQAKANADKLAADRHSQIQLLTNESDTRDKQLAELKAQLQQTQQSKAELENQLKQHQAQIESLTRARDEEIKKSAQHAKRVAQLEAERAELDTRQHLFSEEMIRAEAQIDLIKDVLLREQGL